MSKVVGDIAVQVGADVAPLQRGMKQASGSVKDFDRDTVKMARNMVKVGAAVVTAVSGIATGLLAAANQAAQFGNQINNLSQISGVGTTEFQRLAAAAKTVGIENEKLADIFKDVNDKIGDFNQTGGGPLADFFENIAPLVGVTADEFARLSGPEALQLYVSSLEKAGASQQQMTFYMEAIASDATALLPLLRDNGAAFSALGDEAEAAGRVLSEEAVAGAVELERELQQLTDTLKVNATAAILEHKDELVALAAFVTETALPALIELGTWFFNLAEDVGDAAKAVRDFSNEVLGIPAFGEGVDPGIITGGMGGTGLRTESLTAAGREMLGLPPLAPEDDPRSMGPFQPLGVTVSNPPPGTLGQGRGAASRDTPARSGGGGGRAAERNFQEELEKLQEQFATEAEIIEAEYQKQTDLLAEFRANKVATEEEYNALEERIHADHAQRMAAIDQAAQQARLQAVSGALGDLSSLMQSENKKLFKVGQAAALAEATISGYQAAVDAWQKGMKIGGPPVAAAFTAASLAKTGMLISQIKGASASGGGGQASGGGGGSVPSAAAAETAAPRAAVNLTLIGDQGFSRAQIVQVAEAVAEATGDGSRTTLNVRGRR